MDEISEIIEIGTCVGEEFVGGVWEGPEPASRFHLMRIWARWANSALKREDAEIGFGAVESSLAETDFAGEFEKVFCRAFTVGKFGDKELGGGIELEGVVVTGLFIEACGGSIDAGFAAFDEAQDADGCAGEERVGGRAFGHWG